MTDEEVRSQVCVSVIGPAPSPTERAWILGGFHEVWPPGVTIGSDPGCTIVLPGLSPVAALMIGGSNHKVLYLLPPDTKLPLSPEPPHRDYDDRVNSGAVEVGRYRVRFDELAYFHHHGLLMRFERLHAVDPRATCGVLCSFVRSRARQVPSTESDVALLLEPVEAWVRGGSLPPHTEAPAPAVEPQPTKEHRAVMSAASRVHWWALRRGQRPPVIPPRAWPMVWQFLLPERPAVEELWADGSWVSLARVGTVLPDPLAPWLDWVDHQPWPRTRPTPEELGAASVALQQAWSAVADAPETPFLVADLFAAQERADRAGLDPLDRVALAVAERVSDEGSLRALRPPGP